MGLWLAIALGLLFTTFQAIEYSEAAFGFSGNIYGASFFMATGFHGFHVIIGTIFLAVCLARVYAGHFTPTQHVGFEAAAWYWHFVDVVWLFLFAAIYIWGSVLNQARHIVSPAGDVSGRPRRACEHGRRAGERRAAPPPAPGLAPCAGDVPARR